MQYDQLNESDEENLSKSQIEELNNVAGKSGFSSTQTMPVKGNLRELVWNSLNSNSISLQDISNEYQMYLNSLLSNSSTHLSLGHSYMWSYNTRSYITCGAAIRSIRDHVYCNHNGRSCHVLCGCHQLFIVQSKSA